MAENSHTQDNLIRYQLALAVADNLYEEGFISEGERREIYTIIRQKYGIDSDSIFAA